MNHSSGLCFGALRAPKRERPTTDNVYYIKHWKAKKEGRYDDALKILLEGISKGDRVAMWLLGDCYRIGCLVKQDFPLAHEWYEKSLIDEAKFELMTWGKIAFASTIKNTTNQYVLGRFFHASGHYKEAFDCFAKAEHKEAIYWIGFYLYSGYDIVPENKEKGIEWYRKSCLEGDFNGMYELIISFIEKRETTKAWWWHNTWKRMGGVDLKLDSFNRFNQCYSACLTLLAFKKRGVPKDILKLIVKFLWKTRSSSKWAAPRPI